MKVRCITDNYDFLTTGEVYEVDYQKVNRIMLKMMTENRIFVGLGV